jgi:hypothetical protein
VRHPRDKVADDDEAEAGGGLVGEEAAAAAAAAGQGVAAGPGAKALSKVAPLSKNPMDIIKLISKDTNFYRFMALMLLLTLIKVMAPSPHPALSPHLISSRLII